MTDESRPSMRQIFDEHARYIWRTLRHLGIPEADTPDLCQEVFVIVHRRLPSFEGRSSLRTWLYGICLRVASEHRRRPHVRKETPLSEPPNSVQEQQATTPDSNLEQRNAVEHLLSVLDEDKRQVIVLYEIEGFSMKEVAEILECPLQTAYSRLHAARALMLAAFNAEKGAGT
jgi:RNA polymerase sigma-70 factor, ECF subfamily